jgi:hypothetical protein
MRFKPRRGAWLLVVVGRSLGRMWRTVVITGPHELESCRLKLMDAAKTLMATVGVVGLGGAPWAPLCLLLPPKACLEKAPPARPESETS